MSRRKHGKIDKLDAAVRSAVDEMIMSAQFTYADIAQYIAQSTEENVSLAAVCRYAKTLQKDVQAIHIARENIRVIAEECAKTPDMDSTEGIVAVISNIMMSAVGSLSPDDLKKADPMQIIRQASELVRAVSYKRSTDIKSKEIKEAGFDAVKEKLFAGIERDNPELYRQLVLELERQREKL